MITGATTVLRRRAPTGGTFRSAMCWRAVRVQVWGLVENKRAKEDKKAQHGTKKGYNTDSRGKRAPYKKKKEDNKSNIMAFFDQKKY